MHILFVAPTAPIPTSGGRTRLYNLVKQLSARHQVSVLTFVQPAEYELLEAARPYCRRLEIVPFAGFKSAGKWRNRITGWRKIFLDPRPRYATTFPVQAMRLPLRQLLSEECFDIVVLQSLFVVEMKDELKEIPAILSQENVESDISHRQLLRAGNIVHRLRDWLKWRKLYAFETDWLRQFQVCVAVSENDAALLKQMSPKTEISIVPNGVDSRAFLPPHDRREAETLLFFGVLSYGPNRDGIIWFCREVLPIVRAALPGVRLEIAGIHVPPQVAALDHLPGVDVIGFVPDIRSKLWSATAAVVPLFVGGGTRLKILEAMAAKCPVVSTTIGAEGLDLTPGRDLLIADDAELFAGCIVALLENSALRQELANNGRLAVAEKYDWQQIAGALEAACQRAAVLHSA